MKRIFTTLAVLVVAGLLYLAIAGSKVQVVSTDIEISAPPPVVWSIISDISKWADWSPIIKSSKGTASVGSELLITMMGKEQGEDGPTYRPIITDLKEPGYFRWRAHMLAGFLFTNEKIFELEETSTGTRLIHKELFKGMLAPVFCKQMEKGVPPMLNSMNKALKNLAEK